MSRYTREMFDLPADATDDQLRKAIRDHETHPNYWRHPKMKTVGDFFADVVFETAAARAKFPEQTDFVTLATLTEEVGELNQAVLQHKFEPQKAVTKFAIYREAVQVATMALRVALDCGLAP